ncbi:MAG: hypothetical protein KY476_15390 [Planctomycetes bacterium]|nr:hypothetical protein [Planctomycetota bacterium]
MSSYTHRGLALAALVFVGAKFDTENFEVTAPTTEIARRIAYCAEDLRRNIALEWLGSELPSWEGRCPVRVYIEPRANRGETSYRLRNGRADQWQMSVHGSPERIVEAVLPHEISHAVLATHFGRALPRWADEGAALFDEGTADRLRKIELAHQMAAHVSRGPQIHLRELMSLEEYPRDSGRMLAMYARSLLLTEFLVAPGGRRTYLDFLDTSHREGWDVALHTHYGFRNVEDLEVRWTQWLQDGRPRLSIPTGYRLADALRTHAAGVEVAGGGTGFIPERALDR